jgi:uncharacterized membrane protein
MHGPKLPPAHSSRRRSIAKTVSWRGFASIDTFLLGYIFTGSPMTAGSIAVGEVLTKMVLYYFHERVWTHVRWGYVEEPPATLAAPGAMLEAAATGKEGPRA